MTFRHHLVAAVRSIQASPLLSAVSLFGLTLGLAGAMLMGVVISATLSYNRHVPGHQDIYLGVSILKMEGTPPNYNQSTSAKAAQLVRLNVPEVRAAARLAEEELPVARGGNRYTETVYWADPNFFAVLQLPVVAGDAVTTLQRPDGLVLTETLAHKYFGDADALRQTLSLKGRQMTVGAVLADPPANATDLAGGIFVSGRSAVSALAEQERDTAGGFSIGARTYFALQPGADADAVQARIAPLMTSVVPEPMRDAYRMGLVRIDRLGVDDNFFPGVRERLTIAGVVAALVLFIAVANFVNLSVALANRRQREIGVRKANGASPGQLIAQFLAETAVLVVIAAVAAALLTWLLLPVLNAFLETGATVDTVGPVTLGAGFVGLVAVVTLLAGAYPAFVLSSFAPASILRGRGAVSYAGGGVRAVLVVAQFAVLVALIVATVVVYQQRRFAIDEALRVDVDQVLTVAAACPDGFRQQVERLPGVRGTTCSGPELFAGDVFAFIERDGRRVSTDLVSALPSLFALYGVRPVAGSLAGLPPRGEEQITRIVLNETAVRRFGFTSNAQAVGQRLTIPIGGADAASFAGIVAVVPDFALYSAETAIKPTIYLDRPTTAGSGLVSVKLTGTAIPETLAGIDAAWSGTGATAAIDRRFVSDRIEELYRALARNAQLLALFSGLTILLACLGLVALAISVADLRTKEIGIRKAMGADTGQIQRLLLWQFSRPVLIANLIAWPITWFVMQRWLDGFAYHVDLHLWLFPLAGVLVLLLALGAVGGHAYRVARQKPIYALKYE